MDTEATVRSMFALAGVTPPEDEMQKFFDIHEAMREQMASLYAVPNIPLVDGVLVFRAAEG